MSILGEVERLAVADQAEAGQRGVLRFITAGSVDDGKSTLIGRLLHDTRQILEDQFAAVAQASHRRGSAEPDLSLLTDGLEAEREQGITIDVAYRYFATPQRKFIIADTPGHEQYTRNMVTGASTAHAAVILADAGKGLLAQGRRHLYITHLLGIRDIVVAVNKMDAVGYSQQAFESVRDAFSNFARGLGIGTLHFVPVSALRGDMVVERGADMSWYTGATLLEILESLEPVRAVAAGPLRFPVQLVARPDGANGRRRRGYLGRIASGSVRAGDMVTVLPSGMSSRVSSVRTFEGDLDQADAPLSVTLELEDEIDVARGDMIVHAPAPGIVTPAVSRRLEAKICWLHATPLDSRRHYLVKQTTRTVKATFTEIDYTVDIHSRAPVPGVGTVGMNDIAHVKLRLHEPLVCDSYDANRASGAFIVIDPVSNTTVAAGMVAAA